ncbi:MAG: DUF2177 family protein [Hyphomonadaceae bacterium]
MTYAIAWLTTALTFLVVDAIWLSQMVGRIYRPYIGPIMAERVDVAAAGAFYVIYTLGVTFLAVSPALEKNSLVQALVSGAVVGLVAYATYDLTNQATLKVWDIRLTLADMAWGAFATALASGAAYLATSRLS